MTVVVVTDSSACLGDSLTREMGIDVAPLHVLVDGVDLREGVDPIPTDFVAGGPVTTSGASPGELATLYRSALERSRGAGVVAVHVSRGLSSTWEAARRAASEIDGDIRVVDSSSVGMGLGYAALAAARAAARGDAVDDVYDVAVAVAARSRTFVVVDRLEHLRRGGRIGTAAALVGTALSMKPVLHLSDGKLVLGEKTRTTSKALNKLVDAVAGVAGEHKVALTVHHMQCPDRADTVAASLRERISQAESIDIVSLGAVLGAHVGPGAVGVAVCVED